MKNALAVVAVIVLASCTTVPDVQALSHECEAKYRSELPPGAIEAKLVSPIRIAPQRDRRSAYACVVAIIDEHGRVVEARVAETDSEPFGEYLLKLVKGGRYQPAMLNGKPFAHQAVVAASYE